MVNIQKNAFSPRTIWESLQAISPMWLTHWCHQHSTRSATAMSILLEENLQQATTNLVKHLTVTYVCKPVFWFFHILQPEEELRSKILICAQLRVLQSHWLKFKQKQFHKGFYVTINDGSNNQAHKYCCWKYQQQILLQIALVSFLQCTLLVDC